MEDAGTTRHASTEEGHATRTWDICKKHKKVKIQHFQDNYKQLLVKDIK